MKRNIAIFMISAIIISWIGALIHPNVVFADRKETLENEKNDIKDVLEKNEYSDNVSENKDENSIKKSTEEEVFLKDTEIEKNNELSPIDEFDRNKEIEFEYGMQDGDEFLQDGKADLVEREEKINSEKEAMVSLQIPEKLDVTIDPFEINGKGQIYSKKYCIKNSGGTTGVLRITNFACTPGEDSGVTIKKDSNGIHNVDEKFVYIEMVFGNGDKITLPSEEEEYEVRLEPGEELRFFYRGEVNENALQGWKEHDLTVGMVYFWNIEEEEKILALDSENAKNTSKEDELGVISEDEDINNEDMSDISENKDFKNMGASERFFFEKNIDEEDFNNEEEFKNDDLMDGIIYK